MRCCASWRSRSSPTARAPPARGGSWCAGPPTLVEPVARAVANSPLVKTALHGADPNFGRILQATGMVCPPGSGMVADLEIEGRLVVSGGDAIVDELSELEGLVQGREVEYALDAARKRRGDRGVLLRSLAGIRPPQRGVHDLVAPLADAPAFDPPRAASGGVLARSRTFQVRHARCVLARHLPVATLGARAPTRRTT